MVRGSISPLKRWVIGMCLSVSKFLDRAAALIPPPRKHRHRYFGVLAPNSPWRALVAANAGRKLGAGSKAPRPKTVRTDFGATRAGHPARYLWAQLLARIYGVFALKCSGCGGRVRLVGFITEPATVRQILEHVGEPTSAPAIAPARSPLREMKIGQELAAPEARHDRLLHDAGVDADPIPELEFDQTMGWKSCDVETAHVAGRGLVWTRRWRGAVSGVVFQIWIVDSVHSSLVTRIKSLRTPNKSGL